MYGKPNRCLSGRRQANRFYLNVNQGLDALLAMVFPLLRESVKSERYLTARRLQIESDYSGPWSIDVRHSMLSWQVAMRVSAVEVYLQDALTFLALYEPEFIKSRGSKQEWDYDLVRTASDNENAMWIFCDRWARSFIGEGGPTRWGKSMEKSGLGTFNDSDIDSLEVMWGYRHMRVHHNGRFTREFVARHPQEAKRLWRLQLQDIQTWSETAQRFVHAAEVGISGRLRARLGKDLIKEREDAEFNRQMEAMEARFQEFTAGETPEQAQERITRATSEAAERFALMRELFDHNVGGGKT